jgi:ferric-dicitrate binding protein FerR (iron transport regulator)
MFDPKDDLSEKPLKKVPDPIYDQAISWAVRIHSQTASPEDYEALAVWRKREPMHEIAWQRIQSVDRQFGAVPDEAKPLANLTLEKTFRKRTASRRKMLKIASLAAVAVGTGLLIDWAPWRQLAIYSTNLGVRRSVNLDDGSRLRLNSGTRIEIDYSPFKRTIRLKQGEVYIETGTDSASVWGYRGFWVETVHARLEAIGTRFNVCKETERTQLHVVDGAVAVQLATGRVIFHPGDTIWIDTGRNRLKRIDHLDHDPTAWIHGAIVARRMRLSDFAVRLNRHYATKVRVAGNVEDLLISGVFQLDGSDALHRTLNAIASSLPVKVDREKNGFVVH